MSDDVRGLGEAIELDLDRTTLKVLDGPLQGVRLKTRPSVGAVLVLDCTNGDARWTETYRVALVDGRRMAVHVSATPADQYP